MPFEGLLSKDRLKKTKYMLHKMGYSYFDMNRLTIVEINDLISCWNVEQREKSSSQVKQRKW